MAKQKIEDVEGIGPAIGGKLRDSGIAHADALLAEANTPKQRKALAERPQCRCGLLYAGVVTSAEARCDPLLVVPRARDPR
ncbi:MAG TPA: hypothetical protein VFZ16_02280 [Hyphomicrobiaceae bacterium]|nr:hypothetical protein [Hyphomicrobiaceae bacterium]